MYHDPTQPLAFRKSRKQGEIFSVRSHGRTHLPNEAGGLDVIALVWLSFKQLLASSAKRERCPAPHASYGDLESRHAASARPSGLRRR
eukprot:scaffold118262_cov33-Phaeocystis_antarctica.AAC.2